MIALMFIQICIWSNKGISVKHVFRGHLNITIKVFLNVVNILRRRSPSDVVIVSPVRSTYGGYYGLVVVTPPRPPPPRPHPRPQTLHRSHDNLKNPYRIASIFYM